MNVQSLYNESENFAQPQKNYQRCHKFIYVHAMCPIFYVLTKLEFFNM
jgi:hypothetical protein